MKALVCFVFCCVCGIAAAGQLTNDQATHIWVLAWGQTHSIHNGDATILNSAPTVNIVPQEHLCKLVGSVGCITLRAVTDTNGQVLISETVDFGSTVDAAILFHEFVHVIQQRVRGLPLTCDEYNANEWEARQMHAAILYAAHEPDAAAHVLRSYRVKVCK